jgi:hypothetical protein
MCTIALRISLTFSLANRDHAQLKQSLNRRKGGHERLIKSYEKLRQEMQGLIARDGQYQDDTPSWLYHQPTQQGIRAMLDLQRAEEELERLEHERSVMYSWLLGQGEQLQLARHMAQGIQPIRISCHYSDSTNHKAIPLFFTRSNCAPPTSFISVRLGI